MTPEDAVELGREIADAVNEIGERRPLSDASRNVAITSLYVFAWMASYVPEVLGYALKAVEEEFVRKPVSRETPAQ